MCIKFLKKYSYNVLSEKVYLTYELNYENQQTSSQKALFKNDSRYL